MHEIKATKSRELSDESIEPRTRTYRAEVVSW